MLLFVRSRQRNLENFQLHHSYFFSPINTLPEHSELKNVTSFQFFLETEEDSRRACRVIQNATTVLSLDICISGDTNVRGDYFGKRCLSLMQALFDYYHLADLQIKIRLFKLRLKQLNLSYAGKILLEMLDFRYMTDLTLDGCKDCRGFLEELSQRDHSLKAFSDERGLEFCGGFDRSECIVSSATSLVHVTLSSAFGPSDSLPCSLPLFLKHGTTLRSLVLDESGYSMCTFGVPGRSLSAFRELSFCCPRLEFLAITIPALGAKGLCDHEDLIVSSIVLLSIYKTDNCKKKCLTNLHSLVILRIIVQSQYRGMDLCQYAEEHTEEAGPETVIHAGAQKFANRFFRDLNLHCPDLMNIVIDVRKFGQDCTSGRPRQYAYLRRTQRDEQGETFTFGVQEELRSIKTHMRPHSSTLW